ncbi:MAG: GntR family transcriptional regulator [Planctomycetes bacterium]|nr:GntR family transcriptional regulator [Planctomycetota bacterium]
MAIFTKTPLEFRVAAPASLKYDVTDQLLAAIFRGQIIGGDRLVETTLAELFQVSRGPVREAIQELANTGLVDLRPNRGAVVRDFGPEQLKEIYTVRALLETGAVRLACGRLDQTKLQKIRKTIASLLEQSEHDSLDWSQSEIGSDERLHGLIAAQCGNNRLHDEINRYYTLVRAIRQALDVGDVQAVAAREHLTLIDALLAGDAQAAAECMQQHIDHAATIAMKGMFPRKAESPPSGKKGNRK